MENFYFDVLSRKLTLNFDPTIYPDFHVMLEEYLKDEPGLKQMRRISERLDKLLHKLNVQFYNPIESLDLLEYASRALLLAVLSTFCFDFFVFYQRNVDRSPIIAFVTFGIIWLIMFLIVGLRRYGVFMTEVQERISFVMVARMAFERELIQEDMKRTYLMNNRERNSEDYNRQIDLSLSHFGEWRLKKNIIEDEVLSKGQIEENVSDDSPTSSNQSQSQSSVNEHS